MAQVKFKRGLFTKRGEAVNGMIYFATDTKELWMANDGGWTKYGDGDERVKDVAYSNGEVTVSYENGKTSTTFNSLATVTDTAVDNQFVTGISATNGVVSATRSGITSSQVTRTATSKVPGTDVEAALGNLADAIQTGGTGSVVTVEEVADPSDATVLKAYKIWQGDTSDDSNLKGTINIPKDLVVTAGSVVNGTWSGDKFTEGASGKNKALKLTIANQTAPVYINPTDFIDVYTGGNGINVSKTNEISVDLATNSGLEISSDKLKAKVKSNDEYIGIDSNGAIASKGITEKINAIVIATRDEIDAYTINGLKISGNPTLDGSKIDVDKTASPKETVKAAIERLGTAVSDASAKVDTERDKLNGTATASGTASAAAGVTKESYINVLNKVDEVKGKLNEVGSGSTLIAVDAAGAANAAYNDAVSYTNGKISDLIGDATTGGDTLGELEDRIETLEGKANGYKVLQDPVADHSTATAADNDLVVTAVTQNANGNITVAKNAAGDMLLTGYTAPSNVTASTNTVVAATDSINVALLKIEAELTWIEA